jgi:AbiTii
MTHERGGLLAQIEAGVVDGTVSLSSLLQTCIMLGGRAGSEKMRDWAHRELNGYGAGDIVPEYRHARATVMAQITNMAGYNAITQRIDDRLFPKQVREFIREKFDMEDVVFGDDLGTLEGLASQGTDIHRLIPPWSGFIAGTLDQFNAAPGSRTSEVYWLVPNASIRGILVRIRTALAELVAELIMLTPQDQDVPDKQAADQAVQLVITGDRPTIHYANSRAGDIVTDSSGSEYNFGDITGNVAAGSSDVTQNYNAGFDVTKVREFAALATEVVALLGLDVRQQAELGAAADELHEAVNDSAADKGRMRRAVDAVMGYIKLASSTALRNAAITAGNQAGSELDLAIRHAHL